MKKILCSLVLLITLCLNVHGEEILNEKFDNVQNGGEYYLNLLTNVSVSSTSFDVEKTELYVDDSLYNESSENPAIFDLSEMPAGKKNLRAVCYDAAGNTGTSEVTIIAHEMCKSQVLSYNLDSMEGGQYPNYTEFESSKLSGSCEA